MLVACIDVIGPLSTDAYIPNLPEMQRELDAPAWLGGLTLQANWLAKGVATLAIGALADDRRRRGATTSSMSASTPRVGQCIAALTD